MISHLTEDQITRWFIGQASADERQQVQQHVQHCSTCAGEVDGFKSTMTLFQSAIIDRVERTFPTAPSLTTLIQSHTSAGQPVFGSFVEPPSLFTSLRRAIADFLYPTKTETSVAPVEVPEIWSQNKSGVPQWLSIGLHALVVIALIIPAAAPELVLTPTFNITMLPPPSKALILPPDAGRENGGGGGGGGGMKAPTPASKGELPRGAEKQLLPPMVEIKNLVPYLIAEPTIVAPSLENLPQLSVMTFGDPNGINGPPSPGTGKGGGIGEGDGRGVGTGKGPGAGDGSNGGVGGGRGPYGISVEGGVTAPTLLTQIDPQYSDAARRARIQGAVEIYAIVNADGTARVERVTKSLGFGLDEKAIEAVKQWKFRPGLKDGKPVAVPMLITVNFTIR
jgi:protein TonB